MYCIEFHLCSFIDEETEAREGHPEAESSQASRRFLADVGGEHRHRCAYSLERCD